MILRSCQWPGDCFSRPEFFKLHCALESPGGIVKHKPTLTSWFCKSRVDLQRRQWHPTPVRLPGKSHRRRSLVGCSPWGHEELDTTKRLHFDFSLSCIGEGSGNPLQCSCLENPRDRGAWWAAVYGVTQSRTQLKRLSSSSSSSRVDLKSWTFLPGDAANSGPQFKFKKKIS